MRSREKGSLPDYQEVKLFPNWRNESYTISRRARGGGNCCPANRSGRTFGFLSFPDSGSDGGMHKLRNLLGQDLWLIYRNKGARVRKALQGRVRKSLLETKGKA